MSLQEILSPGERSVGCSIKTPFTNVPLTEFRSFKINSLFLSKISKCFLDIPVWEI